MLPKGKDSPSVHSALIQLTLFPIVNSSYPVLVMNEDFVNLILVHVSLLATGTGTSVTYTSITWYQVPGAEYIQQDHAFFKIVISIL